MWNNVFNPNTGAQARLIVYSDGSGMAEANIYTAHGVLVKKLFKGPVMGGVAQTVMWDGKNERGVTVSSGVYVLIVKGAGINHKQKIAVVR
jgi:flagellar hook assembly protein FlgD